LETFEVFTAFSLLEMYLRQYFQVSLWKTYKIQIHDVPIKNPFG